MIRDDFGVFILSHGRAGDCKTLKTLNKAGYSGKIYLIVDNMDDQVNDYKKLPCTDVIVFDKERWYRETDSADNFHKLSAVVYARNACFEIAKNLGLKYFVQLDDDYTNVQYRFIEGNSLRGVKVDNLLEGIFSLMVEFVETTGCKTICMAQGGDFIGGAHNGFLKKGLSRKAMNSFICRTDDPIYFTGTLNDDVNAYVMGGMVGDKLFTWTSLCIVQGVSQQAAGGATDIYLDVGTYVKSFYSVMVQPSCVKVQCLNANSGGDVHRRIHHIVDWNKCCPVVINEKYKKT